MSEETAKITNGKLPPLSQTETPTKRVKKKKKVPKKETETEDHTAEKPSEETKDNEETTESKPKASPRRKVKKTKKPDGGPDTGTTAQEHDTSTANGKATGSKTSLIDKSGEESTPRKKKKKKKKVAGETAGHSAYHNDLIGLEDDIITPRGEQGIDDTETQQPHSTSARILQSQKMEKLFIETKSGFKSEAKAKVAKQEAVLKAELEKYREAEQPKKSTLEWALTTQTIFKTFCLFLHGLTAGIGFWHIIIVYVLSYHDNKDFLLHYEPLAMPVQCMFYILLVLCTVSACDRFDLSHHDRRSFIQAVTLQSGAVSILIYLAALVLSLAVISNEDRIHLYEKYPVLWENDQTSDSELYTWKAINTARGVAAILGWIVLSITPTADRLRENLLQSNSLEEDAFQMDPSMA